MTLLDRFKEHYGHKSFSYKEAIAFGFKPNYFYKLVEEEQFKRFARGCYRFKGYFPENYGEQFAECSQFIRGRSAVCLLDALIYHQLSDEIVTTPMFMVDHGKKTQLNSFRFFRVRNPHWNIGIEKKKKFWITSLERTIVECMIHEKIAGHEGYNALKEALLSKKTSIFKIIKIAEKLGYKKRLAPFFEVFI